MCDNDNYVPRGQEGYNPVNKLGTIYTVLSLGIFQMSGSQAKILA